MQLQAEKRADFGSYKVRTLREKGLIPAELYGHGTENIHLSINKKDFLKVYSEAGESTMITLEIDGDKRSVMIHEIQHHPVNDEVLSIDFYQVKMDEKITIGVPLIFEGEAPGVKEKGGVLIKSLTEIEIEAFPADIPHDIKVDLSVLVDVGSIIKVKDLNIPKNAEIELDLDTVVVSITKPLSEEEDQAQAQEVNLEEIKIEDEKPEVVEEPTES